MKEVDAVKQVLLEVRDHIYQHHIIEVEEMCKLVGDIVPRRCRLQTQRSSVSADTPASYYKRCISILLVDHLLSKLSSHFTM